MTDWTQQHWIPRKDLVAWHFFDPDDSTVSLIHDYSGNARDLEATGDNPDEDTDVLPGHSTLYFDGTEDQFLTNNGSVTMKHAFVLAAFEESAFAQYRGLLTGLSGNWLLTSQNSGTKMVHHGAASPLKYYKAGVLHGSADMQAPMNGSFALIEAVADESMKTFDGIQVGRNAADTTYRMKGWWADQVIYSTEQTGEDRRKIYEYFATRYNIWEQNAGGLKVWPFQPNWPSGGVYDKLTLTSTTVSGSIKARSKSTAKDALQLVFEDRSVEEHAAARAFWNEHYPGTSFVYRDETLTPAVDRIVKIIAPLNAQKAGYHEVTYTLQLLEV